jgi:hypothetical protein
MAFTLNGIYCLQDLCMYSMHIHIFCLLHFSLTDMFFVYVIYMVVQAVQGSFSAIWAERYPIPEHL